MTVRSLSRALDRKLGDQQKGRCGEHAGLGLAKFTPHDLRRTVRTRMAAVGIDEVVAERVLGHTLPGIAKVYNRHDYEAQMRQALTAWERLLSTIIGVAATPSNVVALRVR